MTVSIESTTRKYRGRKAETYEAIRTKQERWKIENAAVHDLLRELRPKSVLDVPVGTGRFLSTYERLKIPRVLGVDASSEMLALARKKMRTLRRTTIASLVEGDARKLKNFHRADVGVCVRFLDLIDEAAMRAVMIALMNRIDRAIICTIRFGKTYIPKSNTATHDEAKFRALLKQHGWRIRQAIPVFKQGWNILLITRR